MREAQKGAAPAPLSAAFLLAFIDATDDEPGQRAALIDAWLEQDRVAQRDRLRDAPLREAAQRLVDAYADNAAVHGLARDGFPQGWKAEMDADDALLCALQDTRTALDGRDRPHKHIPVARAALTDDPEPRVENAE